MPSLTGSEYSESLSMVQPPSLMLDSLPSLSQPGAPPSTTGGSGGTTSAITKSANSGGGSGQISPAKRRPSDVRMECRHTVSGKVGSTVPLAVRRALGGFLVLLLYSFISESSLHSFKETPLRTGYLNSSIPLIIILITFLLASSAYFSSGCYCQCPLTGLHSTNSPVPTICLFSSLT